MKRKITFKDKDKNIFNVDVSIIDGRFSMSGDCGSSSGQCLDSINPKNEHQKKLVDLWHRYHLNDMKAGTKEQEKAINDYLKSTKLNYEYTRVCAYLKTINMYEVIHNGKQYKYGNGWLTEILPSNIEEETKAVCDNIEEIEQEEKGVILVNDVNNMPKEAQQGLDIDINDYSDETLALAIHLQLTIDELEEIEEEDRNRYIYGGINYYVGTCEELEEIAKDYLSDGESWKMAVEADRTTQSENDWIEEVINMDGIGHILNGWDGNSEEQEVNGTHYTICRR